MPLPDQGEDRLWLDDADAVGGYLPIEHGGTGNPDGTARGLGLYGFIQENAIPPEGSVVACDEQGYWNRTSANNYHNAVGVITKIPEHVYGIAFIQVAGVCEVLVVGSVDPGDRLGTSSTSGKATAVNDTTGPGFAIAITNSSGGKVYALLDSAGNFPFAIIDHDELSGTSNGDPHPQYQRESEKGAANGYAGLGSDTFLVPAQIPFGTDNNTVAEGDHTHTSDIIVGSLSAGSNEMTVINDSSYNAFPGAVMLDEERVLVVYRKGTTHLANGKFVGRIASTRGNAIAGVWGSEFDIYDHVSLDVRGEDPVSVIADTLYVSGRHYDGSDNQLPFVLICDDPASAMTGSSTWTKHDITLTEGTDQNYTQGHLIELDTGDFLQPVGWDSGGTHTTGAAIVNDPTDWSAPTIVEIFNTADYAEIQIQKMPTGRLRAHANRADGNTNIFKSTSADNGVNWTTTAVVHSGKGYPMFRRLSSGIMFTAYRALVSEDTEWRQASDDSDTGWSSGTILDTAGGPMMYATGLQLSDNDFLVIYAIENSSTNADVKSVLFRDSSIFNVATGQIQVSSDDTLPGYLDGKAVAGDGIVLTVLNPGGDEELEIAMIHPGIFHPTMTSFESNWWVVVDGDGTAVMAEAPYSG